MTGDDQDFKNVLTTGYTELDYLLGGLQRSHFYIIAARTGRGKSTLAMNIATNAARGQNLNQPDQPATATRNADPQ